MSKICNSDPELGTSTAPTFVESELMWIVDEEEPADGGDISMNEDDDDSEPKKSSPRKRA